MKAPVPVRPGGGLRIVLLLGFGGLLCMLLIAGGEALSTLQQLHANEQAARQAFLARNQCLLEFRSTLDIYGNRIQEYFFSFRPEVQSEAAKEVLALVQQIKSSFKTYPPQRGPEERELLATVQKMLAEQESAVNGALAEDHRSEPRTMSRLFYEEVIPRNRRLVAATQQVELWNQRQLDGAGAATLLAFSDLQAHLTRLLIIILSSGMLLSIGSMVYIMRQDQEARRRYAELVESSGQLSQLSARLLDAQEEERRAISRELHDEVGQSLGALLVDVGRLKAAIPPENTILQEQIGKIKATAETTVSAVRNIALLLRPSMLDDLGLIPAIEWQAREVSRRTQMEVEVDSGGVSDDLAEEYKICIYRITQEALNNAARHSGGRRAWVKIEQAAGQIVVTIRDDGRGFDPQKTRGLGLVGMEERVRRLGGKLEVESKAGEGTVIKAELPYA